MTPLWDFIQANRSFGFIEKMLEDPKNEVPSFRFQALEQKFVDTFTAVCEIFKLYGETPVEEAFNIRQMLETLKIPNWDHIPAFSHYLKPLKDSLQDVRNELNRMFENGPLLIRYYVEENDDLRNKVLAMLKHDKKA